MRSNLLFSCLFFLLLSGCVVNKPNADKITIPDYNKRVKVYDAHYRKRPTPIGISFVFGGTMAGGYLGYNSNLITFQDGDERKPVRPANALIGALVGYSVTSLGNYLLGQNKVTPSTDPHKWMRDANKNYLYLSRTSSDDFTLMHKSAEAQYTVKNLQDAKDFKTCFPNSSYTNSVARQGVSVVSREELPVLISLFSSSPSVADMKNRFLSLSSTMRECIEAKNSYPELNADAEKKASSYVRNVDDLRAFKSSFPNSTYANEIVSTLYLKLGRTELPLVVDLFPSIEIISQVKKEYINKSSGFDQLLAAINRYPKIIDDEEARLASLVTNINEMKSFQNKFGNRCKNIDIAFNNAKKKVGWIEFPDLVTATPFASEALKTSTLNEYRKNLQLELNKCIDAQTCKDFLSRYNGRFEAHELVLKASYKYDYYSAQSIAAWSHFAKKYPEKFQDADNKAFAYTTTKNAASCRDYLNYFPTGSYVAEVESRLKQSIAYEEEQAFLKLMEERRREEARCYLKLISIECQQQDDWTGTDQIYLKLDGEEMTNTARISTGGQLDLTGLTPIQIEEDISVLLELFEDDFLDPDDKLVSGKIGCLFVGQGVQTLYGEKGSASYQITYKIHHTYDKALSDPTKPVKKNVSDSYRDYSGTNYSGSDEKKKAEKDSGPCYGTPTSYASNATVCEVKIPINKVKCSNGKDVLYFEVKKEISCGFAGMAGASAGFFQPTFYMGAQIGSNYLGSNYDKAMKKLCGCE